MWFGLLKQENLGKSAQKGLKKKNLLVIWDMTSLFINCALYPKLKDLKETGSFSCKMIKCKYSLSTCYVADPVLRTRNIMVRRRQLLGRRDSHGVSNLK